MIVVTGSMRSGTSMWMQILIAAGLPHLGEDFPAPWGESLRAANPRGFFESSLVAGVYHATNPHPETGDYLVPAQTRDIVVKVFIPGLVRSDVAFLDRVVATVRPFREVATSTARLGELLGAARADGEDLPPALRWWVETFALVRDIATRGYPAHVTTYDRLLRDPLREVRAVTDWMGTGNARAGAAAVDSGLRRSAADDRAPCDLDPCDVAVFDALYDHLNRAEVLSPAFVTQLNATDARLRPRLIEARDRIRQATAARLAQGALSP